MQEIYVPSLGMASDGVYLAVWHRNPGDQIAAGDVVASIETDKAELEIEAPAAGILGRHRFPAESEVPNGATIAVLLAAGETEPSDESGAADTAAVDTAPEDAVADDAVAEGTAPVSAAAASPHAIRSHDDRRRDPQSRELEPYLLSPRARLQEPAAAAPEPQAAAPVTQAAAPVASPPAAPVAADRTPATAISRHRAAVAAAVSRSWAEIPHFAVTRTVRTESLTEVQNAFRALDPGVTLTDVLLKAYALALLERIGGDEVNLGLAVATERGVAIPVILDVARLDVRTIAARRRAAVERALAGRVDADDAVTPHSTVSNLGAYGVDSFTGIVPNGQTSILTVGAAAARPVVEDGALAVGMTMTVTLNVDHREWDGQHVGEVLRRFAVICAQPILLAQSGR